MQVVAATPNRLQALGPELMLQITTHLKPRYVYRLMQTSKKMLKLVDTEQYWERPAVHVMFRRFEEVIDHNFKNDYMPHVTGLSELVNLEYGYSKSIDIIITRTKNFLRSFLKHEKPEVSTRLNDIVDTNCVRRLVIVGDRLIRKRYKYFCPKFMAFYLAHELKTMKDVVKWHSIFTKQYSDETSRAFAAFSRDVDEDNSIPRDLKAKMLQKVGKLMWTLAENEDYTPDYQYLACELEEFYAHNDSPLSYNAAAADEALDSDDSDIGGLM